MTFFRSLIDTRDTESATPGAGGKCAAVTEEHDSVADCDNFYAFYVCGQPEQAKYYGDPACAGALGSASCVATKSKGNALDFPLACKAPAK